LSLGFCPESEKMKLVLIRHPQPEVAVGICYGKTDLLLREPASLSAQNLMPQLIENLQAAFHIACSPLTRCKQLGLALAALHPNATIHFDNRLQELDFGSWEMQPWSSIGKDQMDAWIASDFDAIHGGESLQALDARCTGNSSQRPNALGRRARRRDPLGAAPAKGLQL
jgi:alpha-ribazole phosphatase